MHAGLLCPCCTAFQLIDLPFQPIFFFSRPPCLYMLCWQLRYSLCHPPPTATTAPWPHPVLPAVMPLLLLLSVAAVVQPMKLLALAALHSGSVSRPLLQKATRWLLCHVSSLVCCSLCSICLTACTNIH